MLSRSGGLVKDLWPAGIGHLRVDDESLSYMPAWKKMPCDIEGLTGWVVTGTIAEREDGPKRTIDHAHRVVHRHPLLLSLILCQLTQSTIPINSKHYMLKENRHTFT
ncbi:hypothetical protein A0H81_02213 [Grifola frondosa]|uniref:Uncharacterized protein n=1 Tax=Grifola frondosa TaxID=5627 RepID=A0A1C7ML49_GRIFR|nr:hypothetical protein A0H81_02213 [Grifola frondosa]